MKIKLAAFAEWLDDRCRFGDLRWQRFDGNVLSFMGVRRENIEAFLWPSLIAAAMWTGMPTLKPIQAWGAGIGFVFFFLLVWANRKSRTSSQDLAIQVALVCALAIGIWSFGPDKAGTDFLVYRNLLIPIVLIVGIALLISVWIAKEICYPLHIQYGYKPYLEAAELFLVRGSRLPRSKSLLSLCIFIPFSILLQPMQLAWPVAIAVLAAPPAYVKFTAWVTAGIMALVLVLTALDDRLDSSIRLLMRRFFRNAALGVTLITLALAAARLLNITYVTTVFDTASGPEILLYFLFAYAIAWWYDYWTERVIGQQLFLLIDPDARGACSTPYPYAGPKVTEVPKSDRRIELLGLGRFLAFWPNPDAPSNPIFQAWTYEDFFTQLSAFGAPGGKAIPLPLQIMQRASGYVGAIGIITAGLLAGGGWLLHQQSKNEELIAVSHKSTGLDLNTLLAAQVNDLEHPAILVAASGGGTRAAVFTAAVLEGLSQSTDGHIVLGSGVSGGAAALSYFAINRPMLTTPDHGAWDGYFGVMEMPYIQDVIERSTESRMVVHGRLGILLAESFERRWGSPKGGRDTFEGLNDFGLICSSTLAGRFDWKSVKLKQNCGSTLADASQRCLNQTKSDVAGGRLMMTNLSLERAFKVHDLPFVQDHLPILVDDKTTRVERAAALSANFPPVFSNAAIDIDNEQRYWVTDGGAADNRGLEPVLYAARDAVQHLPNGATRLPTLKVVIIDASGTSTGFEQNRGLGSALGAGAHFADQLNNEVASRLIDIYETANQKEDLQFYYVPMPNMLRTSGSFGTHWMLQKFIKVDNGSKTQTFKGTDVVDALRAAYAGRAAAGESAQLASWIRKSPEFTTWCTDLSQRMTGQPRILPDCPVPMSQIR
jgi:hypothetical protein